MGVSAQDDATPRAQPESADRLRDRRLKIARREKRRFRLAFALALAFHLSMITVFEIVIPFPKHDMEFYSVSIVSRTSPAETSGTARAGELLALSGAARFDEELPEVALPVIEFAELERLRIRYDASEPLPALDDFFGARKPADSWARFGGELHRLGRSLRELALPDEDAPMGVTSKQTHALRHRPAEGFEAYIEWNTPPHDRELLFAPPMKALWRVNPSKLRRPIEIVFKVNPSGRVVNVWSPMIDDDGLMDDIQMTVLQYRFAPVTDYDDEGPERQALKATEEQSGVLFVKMAEGQP